MLIKKRFKCDDCGCSFEGWSDRKKMFCAKCGKPFTLCPACIAYFSQCVWCGSRDFKREE